MFRLFIFLLFKTINKSYEMINQSFLSKFISQEDLINEIISKKHFFYKWRQKLNTQISNEKDAIKKITLVKKKTGLLLKVKTVHSFKIGTPNNCENSYETLNYLFYIIKFKIVDIAVYEYNPLKYEKMLLCDNKLYNSIKSSFSWKDLINNFDIIFSNYSKYYNNDNNITYYRNNRLYNRKKAVSYAQKYALEYNTSYNNYNDNGGDCTNFMSQCLYAGGLPLSLKWKPYYLPWIRVNELYYYLTNNNFAHNISSLNSLEIGDLIQFFSNSKGFFAHSGIITNILDNGEILYSCHSFDKLNFPLSEIYPILYTKLRLLKISF